MKNSSPRKSYKKGTKSKKVTIKPKKETNTVKLQKQINQLQRKMTNEVEVKEIDFGIFQNSVGQVQGFGPSVIPTSGHAFFQIPIAISQGAKAVQRIGNFINLKKMIWKMQVQGQLNCLSPMKFKMEIYQLKGDPVNLPSASAFLQLYKNPNYFVQALTSGTSHPLGPLLVYDTTSLVNTNCVKSQFARKIATKYFKLPQRAFAGNTASPAPPAAPDTFSPQNIREVNFSIDLKEERIGFQPGSPDQLQCAYYVYIFANTGNCGSALVDTAYSYNTVPSSGLGQTMQKSGARVYANVRLSYTDQ